MKAEERRQAIAGCLTAERPISATTLARRFAVSRQIIVGDIALLRAAGQDIVATPRGYKLGEDAGLLRTVACAHTAQETERELLIMVDNGCTVIDVVVDHPLYGQLTGQLSIASRYDVEQFMEKSVRATPLSALTQGIHLHRLRCPDEAAYGRVREALAAAGILYTQEAKGTEAKPAKSSQNPGKGD